MKIDLSLYKWLVGTFSDFAKNFDDSQYNYVKSLWNNLDGSMVFMLVLALICGVGMAVYYYKTFNNRPKRHYHPKFWLRFWGYAFILTFITTFIIGIWVVKPTILGMLHIELKIAFCNALYAAILYFLTSVVFCNWLNTNACRIFKLKTKKR